MYHIGSGQAFFTGLALLLAGLLLSLLTGNRWLLLMRNLLAFVGGIWIAMSACPLPNWLNVGLGTLTVGWLGCEWIHNKVGKKGVILARMLELTVCLAALGLELPYHFVPRVPAQGRVLFLLGDSVSAGMGGEKDPTWPQLLERDHGWEVHDFSQAGATARSALKQAAFLDDRDGVILLEIGGNDVLGPTNAAKFHEHLDELLAKVCRAGRTVVMLELPLPPFANAFGASQRDLAGKYGVILVPKRIFVSVLTAQGGTVDSVHLSPEGHRRMSARLAEVLGAAR